MCFRSQTCGLLAVYGASLQALQVLFRPKGAESEPGPDSPVEGPVSRIGRIEGDIARFLEHSVQSQMLLRTLL